MVRFTEAKRKPLHDADFIIEVQKACLRAKKLEDEQFKSISGPTNMILSAGKIIINYGAPCCVILGHATHRRH